MKHPLIKKLGWLAFWLLMMHFVIEVSGHGYLYNTLSQTVFKGQLGPGIQEYREMPNRAIEVGSPSPWKKATSYNQKVLTETEEQYHIEYESVSFMVVQADEIVFESYWQDFDQESLSNSFSMAKSVVSALTGIAIDQGYIKSVNDPVYWYLPQYETELGKELTIKHLLTMSSGINFQENYLNPFAFPAKANYGDNLEQLLRNYTVTDEPGVMYNYQSGATQVLGMLLKAATRQSLAAFASEHLWSKIGAEQVAYWTLDHEEGVEKAFCCINSTARDFARMGKLYLNYGDWEGSQILDSAYVAQSIQPADLVDATGESNKIYGYSWWLGTYESMPFFFMRGIKGQYVIVLPERDLIVTRLGRKRHTGSGYEHPEDVYRYLEMGLRIVEE